MRKLLNLAVWAGPCAGYWLFLRPQLLKWGTVLGEGQRRLPGDEVVPAPNQQITQAVNIKAPPSVVWAWLAQMGRDHTGWYGIDWLGNQGVPSATYLRDDIPPPEVGMRADAGYQILRVEPGRVLVFGGFDVPLVFVHGDVSLAYVLEPRREGTRLLARMRLLSYGKAGGLLNKALFEWVDALELRQQLIGIRARVEAIGHSAEAAAPVGDA